MQALVLLPQWDCQTCTAVQKVKRGCTEDATHPVEMDGEKQLRCPRRLLLDKPEFVTEIWWLYSKYVEGILPEHGGLYDQPAKFLAVMRVLDSARAAADSEKDQQEQRRQALQAQANSVFSAG
jgi:hypothetical protein